ncbi:hypothetical protein [Desulfurococcus mucosus]|uniref:Uncharacterized protein n=1 Tax=Desulfurococcus mucosus (strain ATCC 35584 / DSM 2162 / JCM 9187 / O7/1) TaxID=765177 RepID=E8R7T5_DESM0|nr:hypothetical protein [Desulfurococcus mucosus]ADV64561.1 hypothetical protein Desmu_0242 [Desulfurococcus mucosus DSM 2162]
MGPPLLSGVAMRLLLIVGDNELSEIVVESVSHAVKTIELSSGAKIRLEIMRDNEVVYPTIKINGLSPIVITKPPNIVEIVKILRAHVEISELLRGKGPGGVRSHGVSGSLAEMSP